MYKVYYNGRMSYVSIEHILIYVVVVDRESCYIGYCLRVIC